MTHLSLAPNMNPTGAVAELLQQDLLLAEREIIRGATAKKDLQKKVDLRQLGVYSFPFPSKMEISVHWTPMLRASHMRGQEFDETINSKGLH